MSGGGETGALMRGRDWGATSLGSPHFWPEALKTVVGILLASSQPMCVIWGPERSVIYNDGYARLLGERHPAALGRPFAEVWQDAAGGVSGFLERTFSGEALAIDEVRIDLKRTDACGPIYLSYSSTPIRDEAGAVAGVFCTCADITARVGRQHHERFMAELSDRLRTLDDAGEVMATAAELVGRYLQVDRCGYGEVDESERFFTVEQDWTAGIMPSIAGRTEIARFGAEVIAAHKAGLAVRMNDERADTRTAGAHAAYEAIGTRAGIGVPLIKDGRLCALFYIHHSQPRIWSDDDETLVREVAERTWNAVRRSRAETALRKSEARFRALVKANAYRVYTLSADWSQVLEIDGEPPSAALSPDARNWRDFYIAPEDRAFVDDAIAAATRDKSIIDIEHRIRRTDGRLAWIRSCSVPFLGRDGEIVEWFGGATDITERRIAEERLRAQEQQLKRAGAELRAVLDAAPIAVWFTADPEARYWRRNRTAAEWLGLPTAAGDQLTSDWQEMSAATSVRRAGALIAPEDYPLSQAVRGKEIRDDIIRMQAADGTIRDLLCNAVPLYDDGGRITGAVCAGTDITAQLETERRLRELTAVLEGRIDEALAERKILADVVAAADAFVQVIDLDYRWLAINETSAQAFEDLLGTRPKAGDSLLATLAPFPDDQAQVSQDWARALAGEEFTETRSQRDRRGVLRHFEARFAALHDREGKKIGAYQWGYDITERVESQAKLTEAQAQLHEMQKLETIGQLTGNVAHDFNNLLTPIVGTLSILHRKVADDRTRMMTDAALQAADRARILVQRLLAFARRQHLEARAVSVGPLVEGLSDLMQRSVGPTIALEVYADADLPPAHVDPNQLELALLNLAVNARDAMPQGGRLTIRSDGELVTDHPTLKSGRYVRITVADTGVGMDSETLRRAIEPFFTTKGQEKGTGLGLSMVHGLAAQSGGDLVLRSCPGEGTSAVIWLPVSSDTAAEPIGEAKLSPIERTWSQTVLLVDDEPLVRSATASMLRDVGFQVVEAESGERAIERVRAGLHLDAVVTDYTMPGMSGAALVRQLRGLHPALPVLLITGYASVDDPEAKDLIRLSKPFGQSELIRRIAEILDEKTDRGS